MAVRPPRIDLTPGMACRPLRGTDGPLVAAMHNALLDQKWSPRDAAEILSMQGAFGFLAGAGGQPLGFAVGLGLAGHGEVLAIAVTPAARRQGCGHRLLTATMAEMDRRGAWPVTLEVAVDNLAARAFYAATGFHPAGRRIGYYRRAGDPVDALVLKRSR